MNGLRPKLTGVTWMLRMLSLSALGWVGGSLLGDHISIHAALTVAVFATGIGICSSLCGDWAR